MDRPENPLSDDRMPFKRQSRSPRVSAPPEVDIVAKARSEMPNIPDTSIIREQVKKRREEEGAYMQYDEGDDNFGGKTPEQLIAESMLSEGLSASSQNPQYTQQPSRSVKDTRTGGYEFGGLVKKKSPLVSILRQKFGVDSIPTIDREIGGMVWTFRKAGYRDKLFAKMAANLDIDAGALAVSDAFDLAKVCSCIVAVNSVPVWKALEVLPRPGEHIHDPLFPPPTLQQRAAGSLYDEMLELNEELPVKLIEAYQYEYRHTDVSSYLDFVKDSRFRFTCTHENCDYEVIDIQMINPTTKEKLPYFCKFHGTPLEVVGEATEYPLT